MRLKTEFRRCVGAVRSLSCLGRCQVSLLAGSLMAVTVLVAIDPALATLSRLLVPALVLNACTLVLYTIAYENAFAFGALVITLCQLVAFVSVLTLLDAHPSPARVAATVMCAVGSGSYAILQIFARGTWGWHAFRAQLITDDLMQLYRRVQLLHASLLMSLCNASAATLMVIFLPRMSSAVWLDVTILAMSWLYLAVSCPLLAYCVHRDDARGAAASGCLFLMATGCNWFVAVDKTRRLVSAHSVHEAVGVCQLWVAAVAQLVVCVAFSSVRRVFGTEVLVAIARARAGESSALIDNNALPVAPHRRKTFDPIPQVCGRNGVLQVPADDAAPWSSDDDR
jgi:hypothetical protein